MNATAVAARHILRDRSAATRTTASLRRGRSLATHLIHAGVGAEAVPGVVSALRTTAKRLHVDPVKTTRTHRTTSGKTERTQRVHHYTAAQVHTLALAYKPRKADYVAARALLLAA